MAEWDGYFSATEAIGLSPESQSLLMTARLVGAASIGPAARAVDEDRRFPREAMDALAANGLTALYVPISEGGSGLDPCTSILPQVLVAMEISAWCSSTSQVYGAHCNVLRYISLLGSESLRQSFYREAVQGRFFASFAANGSANKFAIGSRLEPRGEGYVLNGRKHFATSSTGSSWAVWTSMTADDRFAMPMVNLADTGITIVDNWKGMGQRGTGSGVAIAENVAVPACHMLHTDTPAFRTKFLENATNLVFAAQYAGQAMGAYRAAIDYVRERTRPWRGLHAATQDPFIQLRVADMAIKINAARQMVIHAARVFEHHASRQESDLLCEVAVAQAKVVATEAALDVTSGIFQVMGASSATAAYGFDRYFRDARTLTLHDPVDRRREAIGFYELGGSRPESISPTGGSAAAATPYTV